MSEPRTDEILHKRLTRLTRRARVQLIWERYAPVLALALAVTAAFLILSFAGVWQYLGDPWRGAALIAALIMLTGAAWRAQKLDLPTPHDAKRRIELDSGLKHRPLDALSDRPLLGSGGDVWARHMQGVRRMAEKSGRPIWRHVLAPIDPYYLRFALPLLLGGAFIYGLGDNRERLRHAVFPGWQNAMPAAKASFEGWIDPPAYTGRPPIYFKSRADVDVPEGSTLVTRINGLKTVPRLRLGLKNKTRYIKPTRLGPRLFETRSTIDKSGTARYRLGRKTQNWGLNVIPDRPPHLSIDVPPEADKRDRLVVTYSLNDDYGVEKLEIIISQLGADGREESVTLPIAARLRKADKAKISVDLTKHVWAGRKVTGYLRGVDGYGHISTSKPAFFTIPDKIFVEPLAKAIIENRNLILTAAQSEYKDRPKLTRNDIKHHPIFDQYEPRYRLDRAAPEARRAVDLLNVITDQPAHYFKDPALFMGLNFIRSEILYSDERKDISHIPEELWKIALRAEFGTLGTALEEMREAERALREAISRRAPQREIDLLFDRYNGAVDTYLEELRRKALENYDPDAGQGGGGEGGGPDTNQDEIKALLKAIEEANKIGDVDGARRALAQLAELLENLDIQFNPGGGGSGDGPPQEGELSEEEQEALEDLAELLGEQRELQSETQRAENEAQNDPNGQQDGEGAGEQPNDQEGQDGQEGQEGQEGQDGQAPNGQQPGQNAQNGSQNGSQESNRGGNQGGTQSLEALREQQQGLSGRLAELQSQLEGLLAERTDESGGESGGEETDDGETAGGGGEETDDGETAGSGGAEETDQPSLEENLEGALDAMRRSDEALSQSELRESIARMTEAIRALRQAGDQLAQEASGQGEGEDGEDGENQSAESEGDDPFGRREGVDGSLDADSEVDLDDKNRRKRARELLEELRDRAAQEDREQLEKDYLDRLLKQF